MLMIKTVSNYELCSKLEDKARWVSLALSWKVGAGTAKQFQVMIWVGIAKKTY